MAYDRLGLVVSCARKFKIVEQPIRDDTWVSVELSHRFRIFQGLSTSLPGSYLSGEIGPWERDIKFASRFNALVNISINKLN